MRSIISKTKTSVLLVLLGLGALSFSFTTNFGGEGFEVYLNNKVVLQQFGDKMNEIKTIKMDRLSANDQFSVLYHHCGHIGKNRTLTFKDAQDKIVKQWNFKDVADAGNRMTCKVKDILDLQKGNTVLKLYYSSSELPKGRQIAALSLPSGSVARR